MSRGAYRAIHVVLIDGPDFQALPPHAKLVFLTLKLNLGPTGIDVLYQAVLEPQTGLTAAQVSSALDTLERGNWIRRGGNIIWIVDGWRYEPTRRDGNANQALGLQRHLNSLPRLPIVDDFKRYYGLMGSQTEMASEPNTNGLEANANGLGVTEDGRRKTDKGEVPKGSPPESGKPKKPRASYPWMGEIRGVLKRVYGKEPKGKFYANILAPLVEKHGIEAVCVELEAYLRRTQPSFINMTKFAALFGTWSETEQGLPAARVWSEIQRTGILHDLTTDDWQEHIAEIVASGAVESRERFEEIWRAANIALLRSTKNERQAIEHLTEVMTRKAA